MSFTFIRKATIKATAEALVFTFEHKENNVDLGFESSSITLDRQKRVITERIYWTTKELPVADGVDAKEVFAALVWRWLNLSVVGARVAKTTLDAMRAVGDIGEAHSWGYVTPSRFTRALGYEAYELPTPPWDALYKDGTYTINEELYGDPERQAVARFRESLNF